MGMEVTVRDFQPEDEAAVLELYKATPELHKNTVVDFLELSQRTLWFTKHEKLFLVAVDENGKLVGFIYVNIKSESINEEKARMLHLVTVPGQRGGGVGRKLLAESAQRLLKDWGISHFYFNVNANNSGMALFAERLGFSQAGMYKRFEVTLTSEVVAKWSNPLAIDWYLDGLDPEL